MATIAVLNTAIRADASQFSKEMKRAAKDLDKFASQVATMSERVGQFGAGILTAAVAGVGALGVKVFAAVEQLDNLSLRLGISVQSLSQLQFTAQVTGVSFDTVTQAMTIFSKNLAETGTQGENMRKALESIGLNMKELLALSPERRFAVVAGAMAKVGDSAKRVNIAMELFGRSGAAILPILAMGEEGLAAFAAAADKAGVTLSEEMVKKAKDADAAIDLFNASLQGLMLTLAIELAPAIEKVVNFMTSLIARLKESRILTLENIVGWARTVAEFSAMLIIIPRVIAGMTALAKVFMQAGKAQAIFQVLTSKGGLITMAAAAGIIVSSIVVIDNAFDKLEEKFNEVSSAGTEMSSVMKNSVAPAIDKVAEEVRREIEEIERGVIAWAALANQQEALARKADDIERGHKAREGAFDKVTESAKTSTEFLSSQYQWTVRITKEVGIQVKAMDTAANRARNMTALYRDTSKSVKNLSEFIIPKLRGKAGPAAEAAGLFEEISLARTAVGGIVPGAMFRRAQEVMSPQLDEANKLLASIDGKLPMTFAAVP